MKHRAEKLGFTLVELMIVAAIIGLLASIAIPNFVRARENSQNARFASDLRVASDAFMLYAMEQSSYPDDKQPGQVPDGMADYLARVQWTSPTAIGGRWDWDYQQFGVTAGVSAYQPTAKTPQLERLDAILDDGDLGEGAFRRRSAGYIFVIEN